jgi:hypothetical protein
VPEQLGPSGFTPEVNIFEQQIGSDDNVGTLQQPEDGCVVTDAADEAGGRAEVAGALLQFLQEIKFVHSLRLTGIRDRLTQIDMGH